MAVAGAPLLITQTPTALRVSVETIDGFVQQANIGLANPTINDEPIYFFEDAVVAKGYVSGTNATSLYLYDADLNPLDNQSTGNPGDFTFAYSPAHRHFAGVAKGNSTVTPVRLGLNADHTDLTFGTMSGIPMGGANRYERLAYSSDGALLAAASTGSSTGVNLRAFRHTSNEDVVPVTVNGATGVYRDLIWSRDGQFLFANPKDVAQPYFDVFLRSGAGNTLQLDRIARFNLGRAGQDMALTPDGVFLAVSGVEDVEGLTVYTTNLYKRSGEDFIPIGAIQNFGHILKFAEDGIHLYDPGATRRAFKRNGNAYAELPGFMTNIPAGVLQAQTSPHIDMPLGKATFYSDVFFNLVTGVQIMSGWKVALLDGTAIFNPADSDVTNVLAAEVHGGSWPQGGIDLPGVRLEKYNTTGMYLTADDVSHIVYGGAMTTRYAVIYDGATNRPLMFVDFEQPIDIENNSEFHLNQGSFGIALVSP